MNRTAASLSIILLLLAVLYGCKGKDNYGTSFSQTLMPTKPATPDTATFGAGCFWCVEAVFQELDGVAGVTSGYSGGSVPHPTYEQVCTGRTGHAEVCQIVYDPSRISFEELLEVFWTSHDPTTLNRQGNDVGTQYRSVIFYHNERQKDLSEKYRKKLNDSRAFGTPVVTEIATFTSFYKAETYHQSYYSDNPYKPYCMFVIGPKVQKIREVFKAKLKAGATK